LLDTNSARYSTRAVQLSPWPRKGPRGAVRPLRGVPGADCAGSGATPTGATRSWPGACSKAAMPGWRRASSTRRSPGS